MNRFLKAFAIIGFITFLASCKKDDNNYTPPRDYNVQYASEKDSIKKYLKTHYMTVDADFNVQLDSIDPDNPRPSIWDQTEYPIDSVTVKLKDLAYYHNTTNTPEYKVYYIKFRQGVGDKPTRGDDVLVSYRGTRLDLTQFDYDPYPQSPLSLSSVIEGWQAIMPLFNAGTYVAEPNSPNPARYENYGAGIMFVPSGLGYYNTGSGAVGAYQSLVFSFKLYAVNYADTDKDGIPDRYEYDQDPNEDIGKVDTDGDYIPNYLDADDDGDGASTKLELKIPGSSPTAYYTFDNAPDCSGDQTTASRRRLYLDATCKKKP